MYEDEEDQELLEALEPVRKYFSGREVTANTVLAAYLRSVGLPAFGEAWETAKRAVQDGYKFPQAVRLATLGNERSGTMTRTTSPFQSRRSLGWFPKQFGPGDIDGVGAKRLLGTPNMDPSWVLVRETAQNSWDARGISPSIDFTLNLRLLNEPLVEMLRSRVFTSDPPGTGLTELLQHDHVWALEVSDRGTVGLGGPIRNDLAIEPGIDRNFIDLVFNIGAPRDVHLGGGTYGFGKTITYLVSAVGTVLIWSRCEGFSGLEDRLIGSAIGEAFNMDGSRYTGRHWWGNVITTESRVEPVVGSLARELGEALFTEDFAQRTSGTSILILDPQLGEGTPKERVLRLADAVTWNLWPKLVADQSDRTQMNIKVQLNGEPTVLPDIEQHPVLSGYAQALLAVRAAESRVDPESLDLRYPVETRPIWCEAPRTLLGHLALTRFPVPRGAGRPAHSVALMRQAELIVKYFERRELDVEGFQWAGVFKAAVDVDDSFSLAEPPAHDDWVPKAVEDKSRRREVNVALRRVKDSADEYLVARAHASSQIQEMGQSVVVVADMLADLLSGQEGSAPTRVVLQGGQGLGAEVVRAPDDPPQSGYPLVEGGGRTTDGTLPRKRETLGHQRETRAARPKVDVIGVFRTPAETPGWSRTVVEVRLSDTSPSGALVDIAIRVGVEGGYMEDDEVVRIIGWRDEGSDAYDLRPQTIASGAVRQFVYESRSDLAIDIDTKLGTS